MVTDHHGLCWLANLKDPYGRLRRWRRRLQEFDVTIFYRSGRKHSDADCISRAPVDPLQQDSDEDCPFFGIVVESDIAARQRADPELRLIIDHLEGHNVTVQRAFKRTSPEFGLKNSVLVKKHFNPGTKSKYLLVIPTDLHDKIWEACHDEPVFPTPRHSSYTGKN